MGFISCANSNKLRTTLQTRQCSVVRGAITNQLCWYGAGNDHRYVAFLLPLSSTLALELIIRNPMKGRESRVEVFTNVCST